MKSIPRVLLILLSLVWWFNFGSWCCAPKWRWLWLVPSVSAKERARCCKLGSCVMLGRRVAAWYRQGVLRPKGLGLSLRSGEVTRGRFRASPTLSETLGGVLLECKCAYFVSLPYLWNFSKAQMCQLKVDLYAIYYKYLPHKIPIALTAQAMKRREHRMHPDNCASF